MILNKKELIKELDLSNEECFEQVVKDLIVMGIVSEYKTEKETMYKFSYLRYYLMLKK